MEKRGRVKELSALGGTQRWSGTVGARSVYRWEAGGGGQSWRTGWARRAVTPHKEAWKGKQHGLLKPLGGKEQDGFRAPPSSAF